MMFKRKVHIEIFHNIGMNYYLFNITEVHMKSKTKYIIIKIKICKHYKNGLYSSLHFKWHCPSVNSGTFERLMRRPGLATLHERPLWWKPQKGSLNTHTIPFCSSSSSCISGTGELEIIFPRPLCNYNFGYDLSSSSQKYIFETLI